MFLGQLLVDPTNVQEYITKHGEELDESAGLFERAGAFKLALTKGKVDALANEIEEFTKWRQSKVDQLKSMGSPKGPGGMRDILNVQSQIAYTEQEIMRKSAEIDEIMATTETYGPGALQLKYQGPETRRQVEIISKEQVAESAPPNVLDSYATKGASMLLPGTEGFLGPKVMGDIGRYGLATFTLGLSEVAKSFMGGGKKFSGEGVKGYITDAGRDFSQEQASVAMTNKLQSGVQAIYSPILGKTPILTKVAPKNEAREIKNVGVNISPAAGGSSQDTVQSKAVYGGLMGIGAQDTSMQTPSWVPFIASVAFAWWILGIAIRNTRR
jgi:hypothetical protein